MATTANGIANHSTPLDGLARALVTARREHRSIAAAAWQGVLSDEAQAYLAQDAVAQALGWFDAAAKSPRYWKSGGAAPSAPLTHAPLAPDGVRTSPADFSDRHFNAPAVEAEIALRLGRDVTPILASGLTQDGTGSLIDAMAVSIEIVDSRWSEGAQAPALLKLADSQSHGALVLGGWQPYAARDWAAQRCETRIGTDDPLVRTGSHPLGEPAWLLPAWLRHATRHGRSVPAGTVVTTGSWIGIVPAARGQQVRVDFAGIDSVTVQL